MPCCRLLLLVLVVFLSQARAGCLCAMISPAFCWGCCVFCPSHPDGVSCAITPLPGAPGQDTNDERWKSLGAVGACDSVVSPPVVAGCLRTVHADQSGPHTATSWAWERRDTALGSCHAISMEK